LQEDVLKVKNHILSLTKKIVPEFKSEMNIESYIMLSNAICTRLTLFNGRRGGEPARLSLTDLKDGFSDHWIDTERVSKLDSLDQKLFDKLKITYMSGKGNWLVPVLIPEDTIDSLRILADPALHLSAGISDENIYIFASTKGSKKHASGWHCLNDICEESSLNNSTRITATKNRHLVSTLYSLLDVDEQERQSFYSHMGHSDEINKNRYQCPPAIKEITKVGKFFMDVDKGKLCHSY